MKSYLAELGPEPVLVSEESGIVAGDLRTVGVQESNELSTIPEEVAGEEGGGVGGEAEERAGRGDVEGVGTSVEAEVIIGVEWGESGVKSEDVEGAGEAVVKSEGIGDTAVQSEGIGDTGVQSEGIGDSGEDNEVGMKSEGISDASMKSEGISDASMKSEGISDASMKSEALVMQV